MLKDFRSDFEQIPFSNGSEFSFPFSFILSLSVFSSGKPAKFFVTTNSPVRFERNGIEFAEDNCEVDNCYAQLRDVVSSSAGFANAPVDSNLADFLSLSRLRTPYLCPFLLMQN